MADQPMSDQDVEQFFKYLLEGPNGFAALREWLYRKNGKDKILADIAEDNDGE